MTAPRSSPNDATVDTWPALPYEEWKDTYETLHMYLQIAGKVKLTLCPFLNQWWEVALHVTARGLFTGTVPYQQRTFDIEFDFIDHVVRFRASDGRTTDITLEPRSVADFYRLFIDALRSLDISAGFSTLPSEVSDPIRFEDDTVHASYDGAYAQRWWRILLGTERAIERFRTPFHGKSSPVNLYWGGFDLGHTRFNGQSVTPPSGADIIMRYTENEANFSVGFWPGSPRTPANFYAYMVPAPGGVEDATIGPEAAQWSPALGEFILPYDALRTLPDPDAAILQFFQSTYEFCAESAGWDRAALEGGVPHSRVVPA